ncbi:MAG: hypothetical protein ACREF1_13980 [Acetobacteraceae bacterium]
MRDREPPELEMTLDGQFTRRPAAVGLPAKIAIVAIVVAIVASGIALAALAVWIALMLIPIAAAAGLIVWGAMRFLLWRARRSLGRQRDLSVR